MSITYSSSFMPKELESPEQKSYSAEHINFSHPRGSFFETIVNIFFCVRVFTSEQKDGVSMGVFKISLVLHSLCKCNKIEYTP